MCYGRQSSIRSDFKEKHPRPRKEMKKAQEEMKKEREEISSSSKDEGIVPDDVDQEEISSSSEDEGIVPDDVDQEEMKKEQEEMKKEQKEIKKALTRPRTGSFGSNVSIKSNHSKEDVVTFSKTHSLLRFPLKHSASTGSICFSSEGDHIKEREEMKKTRLERKSRDGYIDFRRESATSNLLSQRRHHSLPLDRPNL